MKKLALGLVLATLASTAFSGALLDPVMEPELIIEQAPASSFDHGILVPLFFLAYLGLGLLL